MYHSILLSGLLLALWMGLCFHGVSSGLPEYCIVKNEKNDKNGKIVTNCCIGGYLELYYSMFRVTCRRHLLRFFYASFCLITEIAVTFKQKKIY